MAIWYWCTIVLLILLITFLVVVVILASCLCVITLSGRPTEPAPLTFEDRPYYNDPNGYHHYNYHPNYSWNNIKPPSLPTLWATGFPPLFFAAMNSAGNPLGNEVARFQTSGALTQSPTTPDGKISQPALADLRLQCERGRRPHNEHNVLSRVVDTDNSAAQNTTDDPTEVSAKRAVELLGKTAQNATDDPNEISAKRATEPLETTTEDWNFVRPEQQLHTVIPETLQIARPETPRPTSLKSLRAFHPQNLHSSFGEAGDHDGVRKKRNPGAPTFGRLRENQGSPGDLFASASVLEPVSSSESDPVEPLLSYAEQLDIAIGWSKLYRDWIMQRHGRDQSGQSCVEKESLF